jgi:hypothetical protein
MFILNGPKYPQNVKIDKELQKWHFCVWCLSLTDPMLKPILDWLAWSSPYPMSVREECHVGMHSQGALG